MSKEDHSAGRLDVPVQRGFYKTKPGSTFGSHWDPEKVHKVPGYRDPAVYQTKMKERQAALKSQGKAHIPNRHAIQKAAVKQETARTARKRRSPKVKVNRTRPIFAEGQANLVDHGGFAARKEASEDRESSENPGLELMDQGSEFFDGRRRRRNPVFNAVSDTVDTATKPLQQGTTAVVDTVTDTVDTITDTVSEAVKTAIDNTVKVVGTVDAFFSNVATWTEAQAKSAVKFVAGVVQAIERFTEEFVDSVQEAAENVGNFFVGAFKAGKEWFLGFLEEILTQLVDAGEGFTDTTSNLASNAAYPGGITDGSSIESIFSEIGNVLTNTVLTPLGRDMEATGEKIVSAVAAFFGDEDLFSGIFGQIGASAITGLESVITGQSPLNAQTALNELNKIKQICASYLKKYFMPLLSAIQWLANQIADRVKNAIDSINDVLAQFISGLGNGLTWYIGICGELYIGTIFIGTCTLFPFTINGGSDTLSLESVTQEFSIGRSRPLQPTEPSAGKLAGIRIGYIVTNDQTAVQGSAVGRGIEVAIETTSTYPDISVDLSFTQGLDQTLLSLDLGLMGSYNTPDIPAPGSLEFEIFTGYAYGWAPFAALADAIQPPPYQGGYVNQQPTAQNVLLAQHIGRTSGLFQKSAVTGNIREYVLQYFHNLNEDRRNIHHPHLAGNHFYNVSYFTAQYSELKERNFAKLQRCNVDDLVRVSGSAVDGNTRIKYGVFQKSLCLPGAAIYSLAECQEAKRILVNTGTIPASSAAIPVDGWEGVPTGCSVQNGVNVHFGTYPVTNNARLLSGEFATVCRRLFKIGPQRQKECPNGAGITTAKMCKDAFYELQGKFSLPPNEGFVQVQGGSADVPFGCSVRVGLPSLGNSPWFKPYGADFNFQNTGMFQGICKATRYWLERAGMRSCPVGSHITTLVECGEAYKQLKDMFRYPSLRGLVANENPGWEGVPRGCSIQIGSLGADNSPHFNGNKYSKGERGLLGTGTGDFATQAEFQSICKEPSFWRPEVAGQECPAGTQISGELACKAAYESLRDTFSANAKRLLQSGSWFWVPRGCSASFTGSDSTPHVNTYTGVPSGTGDWSSMCWPGRYYIPPRGATQCPTNQQVTSRSECRQALLALLPVLQAATGRESIVPGRPVVVADGNGIGSNGNINADLGVPRWCSYQAGGDYAAHFNCLEPNPTKVIVDNYRPICKILVPNVDPPPDGSCGWRNDD